MEEILLRNQTIVDPPSPWNGKQADILIRDGVITRMAEAGSLQAGEGTRVHTGGYASPGWVDFRTHLTDPGHEEREDLHSLARAAAAGGFTRVLALPASTPAPDNAQVIRAIRARAEGLPVHIHPAGCLSTGAAGKDLADLYEMHESCVPAFSDAHHAIRDAGFLLRALQYVHPFGGLVLDFPLEPALAGGAQVAESPMSTELGLKGIPAIAEEIQVARDLKILEYYPGRLHLGPLTTAGAVSLLRAAAGTEGLSCDVTSLHLFFSDEALSSFDNNLKLWPPLRPEADRQALIAGVADGTIPVISSGHAPLTAEDKVMEFELAGFGSIHLQTSFAAAQTALAGSGISLERLIACFSHNPRRILRLSPATLTEGAQAEITLFDPAASWTFTPEQNRSRSQNSSLFGTALTGRVLGIVNKGGLHLN